MKWWACKLIYLNIFTVRANFLKLLQPIQSLKWMKVITTPSEKNLHYTSGKANVPLSGQKLNLTLKMINLPVLRAALHQQLFRRTFAKLLWNWMFLTFHLNVPNSAWTRVEFAANCWTVRVEQYSGISSARNLEFAICQRLTLVHLRAVLCQWTEVHWRTIGFSNGNLARQYKSWQTLALVQCCRFYERLAWRVVWPYHYNKSTFAQRAVAIAHL